jgi:hypothetical protein
VLVARLAEAGLHPSVGRGDRGEAAEPVLPDEEEVVAGTVGADERITLLRPEVLEGADRGAVTKPAPTGMLPEEGRVVGHGDGVLRAEEAVVLHGDDHRIDRLDALPDPVVVAVDVHAEQPDPAAEAGGGEERVDVVAIDPGVQRGEVVAPVQVGGAHLVHVRAAPVEDETAPVVVHQEEAGIGLQVVLHAELDERLLVPPDPGLPHEVLEDPVFAELGEDLELRVGQAGERGALGVPQGGGSAPEDHQILGAAEQRGEGAIDGAIGPPRDRLKELVCEHVETRHAGSGPRLRHRVKTFQRPGEALEPADRRAPKAYAALARPPDLGSIVRRCSPPQPPRA